MASRHRELIKNHRLFCECVASTRRSYVVLTMGSQSSVEAGGKAARNPSAVSSYPGGETLLVLSFFEKRSMPSRKASTDGLMGHRTLPISLKN
jgi:hypothetical protein